MADGRNCRRVSLRPWPLLDKLQVGVVKAGRFAERRSTVFTRIVLTIFLMCIILQVDDRWVSAQEKIDPLPPFENVFVADYSGLYISEQAVAGVIVVEIYNGGDHFGRFEVEVNKDKSRKEDPRTFRSNGVEHNVIFTSQDHRLQTVTFDGKKLEPTSLNVQQVIQVNNAKKYVEQGRLALQNPDASDEERYAARRAIHDALRLFPSLVTKEDRESVLGYYFRCIEGLQLVIAAFPEEIVVPLLNDRGELIESAEVKTADGDKIFVRCDAVGIAEVRWNDKLVPQDAKDELWYVLPPTAEASIFMDVVKKVEIVSIQRNDQGGIHRLRINGKVITSQPLKQKPYYTLENFYCTDVSNVPGFLIKVRNLNPKPPVQNKLNLPKAKNKAPMPAQGNAVQGDVVQGRVGERAKRELRVWQDIAKKFSVKATWVETKDGRVVLEKEDKSLIEVPIEKLCEDDRNYLRTLGSSPAPKD